MEGIDVAERVDDGRLKPHPDLPQASAYSRPEDAETRCATVALWRKDDKVGIGVSSSAQGCAPLAATAVAPRALRRQPAAEPAPSGWSA
jgi:hypothetical protein